MADVVEITVYEDGSVVEVERPFSEDELQQRAADEVAAVESQAAADAAALQKAADRAAAIDRFRGLGFTDNEISALVPDFNGE